MKLIVGITQGAMFIGEVEEVAVDGFTDVHWPMLYGELPPGADRQVKVALQSPSLVVPTPIWKVKIQSYREIPPHATRLRDHYATGVVAERARDSGIVLP